MKSCIFHCLVFVGISYSVTANTLSISKAIRVPAAKGLQVTTLCSTPEKEVSQQGADLTPAMSLGLRMGVNFSSADFNKGYPMPQEPIETQWRKGGVVGFYMEVPILKRLYLQQEYLYSQMGSNVPNIGTVYKFRYISLPVMLKYKLNKRIMVAAGPELGLLVQANARVNGKNYNITHDVEERSIGAIVGAELMIVKNLCIDARYMHGINHIGLMNLNGSSEFKYKMVQLALKIKLATPISLKDIADD